MSLTQMQEAAAEPGFLRDPILAGGRISVDPFGNPDVRAGGFAFVLRVQSDTDELAVRVLKTPDPLQAQRYERIGRVIEQAPPGMFPRTTYRHDAVLIARRTHPVIVMDWIDGESLASTIKNRAADQKLLQHLKQRVIEGATWLESVGCAHGDINGSNLIVRPDGELVWIDLDGMFTPGMGPEYRLTDGRPSYAHPAINQTPFGPRIDRFSCWLIVLSIDAVLINPSLADRYGQGTDGLLLDELDLLNPQDSDVLQHMINDEDRALSTIGKRITQLLATAPEEIVSLDRPLGANTDWMASHPSRNTGHMHCGDAIQAWTQAMATCRAW
jgi:serine/threonine protein kinase